MLAQVAARTGAVRGALSGLLTAAQLVADPGADGDTPDGVAVVAVAAPGADTAVVWCGDCRAYGWDGARLRLYSNDHTVGRRPRRRLLVTLSQVTPAVAGEAAIPAAEMVILTSNGIHDQVPAEELEALVRAHRGDPRSLPDMIVAAARDGDGRRDDATAAIVTAAGT